jgi:hypothetical protein
MYEEESVNRPQMDVIRKKCDIRTWEKYLFLNISSTNIDTLVPSLYQCVETRSIQVFWLVSATSAPPFQPLVHQRNLCHVSRPSCEPLYATNNSHCKQETFLYEYPLYWVFCPQKTHNRTLLFGSIIFKHGCHFDYWNQPLNLCMLYCYLHCHEAGLCCYLVMQTENLVSPLQLSYFHLWPIYWRSLV